MNPNNPSRYLRTTQEVMFNINCMREVFINNQHPNLKFEADSLEKIIALLDSIPEAKIPPGELSIAFLERPIIIELHKNFFNDPTPTDVMTFTGDPEMDFAGEICVSPDQAMEVHNDHRVTFPYELMLYIVHGWLHLAGYNDKTTEDIQQIRHMESVVMQKILECEGLPEFVFLNNV